MKSVSGMRQEKDITDAPILGQNLRGREETKELDNLAKRIIIEYGDGSSKEVRKGLCLEFSKEEDGGQEMTADMVDFDGMDLIVAAVGFVELVDRMGMSDAMDAYLVAAGKRAGTD